MSQKMCHLQKVTCFLEVLQLVTKQRCVTCKSNTFLEVLGGHVIDRKKSDLLLAPEVEVTRRWSKPWQLAIGRCNCWYSTSCTRSVPERDCLFAAMVTQTPHACTPYRPKDLYALSEPRTFFHVTFGWLNTKVFRQLTGSKVCCYLVPSS